LLDRRRPVDGDVDGDGAAELTVFRPGDSTWRSWNIWTGETTLHQWRGAGDVPTPGDYDGDGKADIAIYRPGTGTWWLLESSTNGTSYATTPWGVGGDTPVPADFDGDGRTDMAVYQRGTWLIAGTGTRTKTSHQWGINPDIPVLKRN
jgi:spore coat protein A